MAGLRVNFGCGQNRLDGFVNVDKEREFAPDIVLDVGTAWPWKDGEIAEAVFNHSMEHVERWRTMFRELWRCCADGAVVKITVPHPRHDNFINDPTHVLRVTPEFLALLSRRVCAEMKQAKAANTPFADYLSVDFEVTKTELRLDQHWQHLANDPAIYDMVRERNNVVAEVAIELKAIKRRASDDAVAI